MRKPAGGKFHSPGLLRQAVERFRGREQSLVHGAPGQPLLLVSYPAGAGWAADHLRDVWLHTLPALETPIVEPYRRMLPSLPGMVVVLLRRHNVCTCLGHFHPPGTESRLARRLATDIGAAVGEIDLAWEAVRQWKPHPLSALAAPLDQQQFQVLHFRAALLTVLLHELEHMAYPERQEHAVRHSSDELYSEVLSELLRAEGVAEYGMSRTP